MTSLRNSMPSVCVLTRAAYRERSGHNEVVDSCRLARVTDADAIACVQVEAWRERYQDRWPEELMSALDPDTISHEWARAVLSPPDPRVRVLVATDSSDAVVGFAALGPSADPDLDQRWLEVVAWEVHPDHRRQGHGSRLMSAVADTATSAGAEALSLWLGTEEDARRLFAASCGWVPDTAHRTRSHDDGADIERAETRLITWINETPGIPDND